MTLRLLRALCPARAPHKARTPAELVRAVLSGNPGDIAGQLAGSVAFNSPIRRYADRRDVVHLLSLIRPVLPAARVERTWRGPDGATPVISAVIDEARLEGLLEELQDPGGKVRGVTLMLRPCGAMMSAIERMAAALEANALPSAFPAGQIGWPGPRQDPHRTEEGVTKSHSAWTSTRSAEGSRTQPSVRCCGGDDLIALRVAARALHSPDCA